MLDETNIQEDLEEYEEYDGPYFYEQLMYNTISPKIKQFINDYYGNLIYNMKSETYLAIEKSIKDGFTFAQDIPDILYRYRTITDHDKFDEALANFIPPKTSTIVWPKNKYWFHKDFSSDDDDDDTYLEDSDPNDLNEDERKAKEIINIVNEMTNFTQSFAHFMRSGYEIILKEAQLFLENTASFDLSILSPEGFEALDSHFNLLIETILEDLEALIRSDINSDSK